MTRTTTLINEGNLLTEQLQAALNYQRVKLRIQDLQRAERYLRAAGECAERFANRMGMVLDYDEAHTALLPWTWIHTKQELMQMAARNSNRYKAFMDWHQQILLNLTK